MKRHEKRDVELNRSPFCLMLLLAGSAGGLEGELHVRVHFAADGNTLAKQHGGKEGTYFWLRFSVSVRIFCGASARVDACLALCVHVCMYVRAFTLRRIGFP